VVTSGDLGLDWRHIGGGGGSDRLSMLGCSNNEGLDVVVFSHGGSEPKCAQTPSGWNTSNTPKTKEFKWTMEIPTNKRTPKYSD